MPATVRWVGGSGDWSTVANWRDDALVNRLPGPDDDALIDVAGVSVTHSAGAHVVKNLTIDNPFTLSGGTLTVAETLVQQNANPFTMTGGILRNAKVVGEGGSVLVVANATLDGVTLGATIDGIPLSAAVQVNDGAITVTGGLTFANGSLLDLGNHMNLFGGQTVGGDGEIQFRSVGGSGAQINTSNQTTFGPGLTIHRVDTASTDIFMNGGSIRNQATIRADSGGRIRVTGTAGSTLTNDLGGVLAADGGTLGLTTAWSNSGQIVANNSTLNLGGTFATDGIGSITRTGGTINLVGLLDNTGRILSLDAATGSWNLGPNGTLRRGSLVTSGGAALVASGGTLDGVTLGATVGGVPASASVQISDHSFVAGGLTFANGSLVDISNKQVNLVGDQTVGGDGEIRLLGNAGNIITFNQITFGPGLTIHRADANSGVIGMGGSGRITNQATIRADAGGQISVGNAGNLFTNAANGVLAAEGGTLIVNNTTNYVAGTLTGGTWQAIGNGTLRITGADITTNAATVVLDGVGARLTRDQPGAGALANLSRNATAGRITLRNGATFSTVGSFTNDGAFTIGPAGTFTTNGTFTQGNAASLVVEIGGTPASGQLGRLATTGTAALDGTLDVRLVNGYGPDPGLSFPILSFASRSSAFEATNGLTVAGFPLFDAVYDATHLTLTSVAVPADPAFVSASPPATIIPGQPVSVPYTVQNRTGTPAAGDWIDSLYLSIDGVLDPSDRLLGRFEHHGGLVGNASYTETLTAVVPPLAEGNYRVIVLADSRHLVPQGNRANDVGASAGATALSVPLLALGGSFSGTIANGQDLYFRLDVPAGRDVQIATDFATAPAAEFVQRYASLPDRTTYDRAAPDLFDLHPQILLTTPQAGRYYVLLHGREGSAAGQPFTIQADFVRLQLATISPNHGSNAGQATAKLTGSGFTPSSVVSLTAGATTRPASSVQFVDGNTLFATFDLTSLAPGAYDVRVVESAETAVAAGAFTVSTRAPGTLRTFVLSPGLARGGRTYPVKIEYFNDGDTDLPAPLLELNAQNALMRLPGELTFRSDSMHVLGINHEGPAGVLPPGYHGSIIVEFQAPAVSGERYDFDLRVLDSPDETINWSEFKDEMRPPGVPDDAWDALFANFTARAGDTLGGYQALLGQTATDLSQLGEHTADVSRMLRFELLKADARLSPKTLGDAVDLLAPAPGLSLDFTRAFLQPLSGRYRLGALGRGWTHTWDASASADAEGDVTIWTPAAVRFFELLPDGTYAGPGRETAELTRPGGGYRLRETGGLVLAFRPDGLLDFAEEPNGNRVTAGYTGALLTSLSHTSGAVLALSYNAQGRLVQVADSGGDLATYAYSGEHLVSVTTHSVQRFVSVLEVFRRRGVRGSVCKSGRKQA